MKQRIIKTIAVIMAILTLMVAEYRFIMLNIKPHICGENLVVIELFGQYDDYIADWWK